MLCSSEDVHDEYSMPSIPLFRGPRGYQKAFRQVPRGTEAMYTDSDGERQSLMIQVIVGEDIGWTYWACGRRKV